MTVYTDTCIKCHYSGLCVLHALFLKAIIVAYVDLRCLKFYKRFSLKNTWLTQKGGQVINQ